MKIYKRGGSLTNPLPRGSVSHSALLRLKGVLVGGDRSDEIELLYYNPLPHTLSPKIS